MMYNWESKKVCKIPGVRFFYLAGTHNRLCSEHKDLCNHHQTGPATEKFEEVWKAYGYLSKAYLETVGVILILLLISFIIVPQ